MEPRSFSWTQIALSAGVINALINAPLGWVLVPPGELLPTWGLPGIAADVLTTSLGIAAGTVLVVTPQIRRQVSSGRLRPPALSARWHARLARWPRGALRRALAVAAVTALTAAPLPIALLALTDTPGLDRSAMTLLKGSFAFVVGALVTPLVAAAATIDRRRATSGPADEPEAASCLVPSAGQTTASAPDAPRELRPAVDA